MATASLANLSGGNGASAVGAGLGPSKRKAKPMQTHMSQEDFDAFGYPKVPAEWTEEWMREQLELEKVDPRVNPNLLLEETDQEFWVNLTRKPYAKTILRTEQHNVERKQAWLQQYGRVALGNNLREELADELEACTPELKRIIAPIFKYRITEISLWNAHREAQQRQVPLSAILAQPEQLHRLHCLRAELDTGGAKAAERLLLDFCARAEARMLEAGKRKKDAEHSVPLLVDTETMAKHMTMAQKLRKDGYIEWHKGAVEEAFASWQEAESYLYRRRLDQNHLEENKIVDELHSVLLKNISQAALKLGFWSDALAAAKDALAIDEEDHKAWFRRACALEGLGRYKEAEEALDRIEDLAVDRADRARIVRDVGTRRRVMAGLADQHTETERRAFQRALASGVFSDGRVDSLEDQDDEELRDLEEELLRLEQEEAELIGLGDDKDVERIEATSQGTQASTSILNSLPADDTGASRFKQDDRVVAVEDLADVGRGAMGTVLDVDKDGDIKVEFDGVEEIQIIFSVDFDSLALAHEYDDSVAASSSSVRPDLSSETALELTAFSDRSGREKLSKTLTQEGASDLLDALANAYRDSCFQQQVAKLARDMRWDKESFTKQLSLVALSVQRELLPRWGFDASLEGVMEAQLALQAAQRAAASDRQRQGLKAQADEVTRLLYGPMYEVVFKRNLKNG